VVDGLNAGQSAAVHTVEGALLVLAGAGTGKTRVITLRIAQMIRRGVDPERIVGLSFTNKAALEMRERLASLPGMGARTAAKVTLSTFHSFALGIVREFCERIGLRPGFGIADEAEAFGLLREALQECDLSAFFTPVYMREKIAHLKDAMMSPADLRGKGGFVDSVMIASVFEAYTRRLRLYNLVDFDDLVYLAGQLLRHSEDIRPQLQARWTHFLIDEYQDTSSGQFDFLRLLIPQKGNVCAVGDDDQSIYAWRGANPKVLRLFLEHFHGAQQVTLDQNYRCSPVILEAANAVIKKNDDRLEKELWSDRRDRLPIVSFIGDSDAEEAAFVVQGIQRLQAQGVALHHCAVLYRASLLARVMGQAFQAAGLAFSVSGSDTMADRKEVRDMLALLSVAQNPANIRAFFRSLEIMGWEGQVSQQESVARLSGIGDPLEPANIGGVGAGEAYLDTLAEAIHSAAPQALEPFSHLRDLICELRRSLTPRCLADALENWFRYSSYRVSMRTRSPSMKIALVKEELLARFFTLLRELSGSETVTAASSFRSPLETVLDRFVDDIRSSPAETEEGKVQFLTIHSSKGLEFENVFLVGLEEGILPHERSLETGSEAEERRLMYVAMTRAKQRLFLSYCRYRRGSSAARKHAQSRPSRFLEDIPPALMSRTFERVDNPVAARQEAARRLFEMFRH
jgi:DNA helicase-2/ATP-dependent DNA helicase PcrA